jgi:hypothetical protein
MSDKPTRLAQIRRAAQMYENQYISGTPISVFTEGLLNKLPMATAVYNWAVSIWSLCFSNQAIINALPANNNEEIDSALLDYSSCGPIPYTIVQLNNEYNSRPIISSISPLSGAGGSTLTISGTNFTGTTAVTFNGVPATSFTVVSATKEKNSS